MRVNIPKTDHTELKEIVRVILRDPKQTLLILGPIGIGKSDIIREEAMKLATEKGLEYIEDYEKKGCYSLYDIRVAQYDAVDIRGFPKADKETTVWLPPEFYPRNKDTKGVLFFDEITLARPSIQGPLYQLILRGRVGKYVVPEGVSRIAAGNRLQDQSNVAKMSNALLKRFTYLVELTPPDIDEWTKWASRHKVNSDIIGFLNYKPSFLYSDNLNLVTPRDWGLHANNILKDFPNDIEKIKFAVGEGVASEFVAFVKSREKVDMDKILDNPDEFNKLETQIKFSVVSQLAHKIQSDNRSINFLLNIRPEFTILTMKTMYFVREKVANEIIIKSEKLSKLVMKYLSDYSE